MCSKKFWIILAVIAAVSSQNSAQAQFQNISEHQKNDTIQKIESYDVKNTSEYLSHASIMHSSQVLFENILANSMKSLLPFSSTNKKCVRDGLQYQIGLKNQTQWAVQMYESSAKYPSSDLELGNFDQCMSARSDSLGIRSAYALVRMRFHSVDGGIASESPDSVDQERSRTIEATTDALVKTFDNTTTPMLVGSVDLLWALCLPDSCTNKDAETSVRRAITSELTERYHVAVEVEVSPSNYTSGRTKIPVTNAVLLACGIFVLVLAIVVAGTTYDSLRKPEDDTFLGTAIRAFSVTRNLKKLTAETKEDEFAIANGIKTLGLVAVIMGHRIALDLSAPAFNTEYPKYFSGSFWLAFLKSPISVETFFVLSGFFMYITIEKRLRDGKPLKFIQTIIYRIARILPMYITVIAIFTLFLPYMGDGPLWKYFIHTEVEYCHKNWWTNMLFINNYVNSHEMCMINSWYLACDMHFFIVGVILTYLIWRWKKVGLGTFGILFAASIYIPAKHIYDNRLWGVFEFTSSNMKHIRDVDHFHEVYIKSYNRITTYFIGMAAAYIYLKIKNSKLKISVESRIIGFIICILSVSACHIVTGVFYLPNLAYNPWHHILYFTLQRIVFSLAVAYAMIVGSISNFGFISSMFECKFVVVLSRISYVIYLVHITIQLQSVGQIRQPIFENLWTLYWKINTDVTTAICYSFILNLLIEAPSRNIFQHIMGILSKNEREKPPSDVHRESENGVLLLSDQQIPYGDKN